MEEYYKNIIANCPEEYQIEAWTNFQMAFKEMGDNAEYISLHPQCLYKTSI